MSWKPCRNCRNGSQSCSNVGSVFILFFITHAIFLLMWYEGVLERLSLR
uniref:Uncharacterized protein n=1 Tax=Anguilla anguilla TaxID=7936 RepID=A0A0E9P9A3_ANGAN